VNPSHPAKLGGRFLRGRTLSTYVTWAAAAGVAVGTAAMIVVLSAFNGLEELIVETYAKVHPDITVTSEEGSRFNLTEEVEKALPTIFPHGYYPLQEQKALLRTAEREVLVQVVGIPRTSWFQTPWLDSVVSGLDPTYTYQREAALGHGVALQLGLTQLSGLEGLELLWPNGEPDLGLDVASHFGRQIISPTYIFHVHPQVDQSTILVDLGDLQKWTSDSRISGIHAWNVDDVEAVKEHLSALDPSLVVKEPKDREVALFKVMKSEGLITTGILGFIVLLASLGLYSATVLLSLEKERQRAILHAMGMPEKTIRRTFWWSGLWVSIAGGCLGWVLGSALVYGQAKFGWITLGQGYVVEAYPVSFHPAESLLVLIFVFAVGGGLARWATYRLKSPLTILRGQR